MKAQDVTDKEFLELLRHHPELWGEVMQILRSTPKRCSTPAVQLAAK